MNLIERYCYPQLAKFTNEDGARHYICPDSGHKLPSVTTILSATSDNKVLREWRLRVGDKKADEIKQEATALGSLLHKHLENYIVGEPRPGGNNYIRLMAERMADQIIARGLPDVEEVWGSEVVVYSPELYAGTTDLIGLYRGRPAIIDFKTANKMRTRKMIDDYFHQLGAYSLAHDERYGTAIDTGVILMVSRACDYEAFIVEGTEFTDYKARFLDRLERFLTK